MHDMIARIAKRLDWATWYHVAYQFPVKNGQATGDLVIQVRPWLRQGDGIKELREYLLKVSAENGCEKTPNIISITRIGA